ncbi:serine hydrolase domain-containing protein [Sediminicola luteus]|uniref:Beta-lactamase-related domain-containing protein n=1 Tax=Sediminicola luteus TaxID=319238 RepID=A0A2A4GE87_9FLAO|nr:serine hydrolase domain-containing protein [Sediminicola luteus]PCE66314.1 hypothetical protein B7P33_03175 [Sediminicola luteus]
MKHKFLFALSCLCSIVCYGQSPLDSLLRDQLKPEAEQPVHSISVYFENAGKVTQAAVGVDPHSGPVQNDYAFRIASATKPFVATIIMQLQEEGKLKLNDWLQTHLTFDSLQLWQGKDHTSQLRLIQLLQHRSGLADVLGDQREAFTQQLFADPQRQYDPQSILETFYALDLPQKAHFAPGEGWFYSDMNYVLLGMLIEKLEGVPLAASIRKRILDPLGMQHTYFEFYETPANPKPMVTPFVGPYDFSQINTSFDWAGGGLVSTHQDLALFIKGLFQGRLISEKSLGQMCDTQATGNTESPYGLGLYKVSYHGQEYFGHYGFYGTFIGYSPANQGLISYNVAQSGPHFNTYNLINQLLEHLND